MTNEQYQKRIQFLDHIKKNYVAVQGKLLLFYFEDYEVDTIKIELLIPSGLTSEYFRSRRKQINGAVSFYYGDNGSVYLSLTDVFIDINFNMTLSCFENNDLEMPIDMQKVAAELNELFELLKSK